MATYKEIIADIKARHFLIVQTCWIADVKRRHGVVSRSAWNRLDPNKLKKMCPSDKVEIIEESLRRFQMI